MTCVAHETHRAGGAPGTLKIRPGCNSLNIAMRPQQRFPRTEADDGTARDRVGGWYPTLPTFRVAVDANTSPADVLDDLNEVNRFAKVESLHASRDLVRLE